MMTMRKTTMNNSVRSLNYRGGVMSAVVVFVLSIFVQWLNWFAYDKLDYHWGLTLATPLILCAAYHFVALDSGKNGNFSRKFLYIFAAVLPLIFGIMLTAVMFVTNPDISTFNAEAEYEGKAAEIVSTYSGRFVITSLYLVIFGIIDMPLLKALDKREAHEGEK